MQFGTETPIDRLHVRIVPVECEKLARAALARLELDRPAPLLELVEIEHIALEADEGGAARAALLPLHGAFLENQVGRAIHLHDLTALREIGRREIGVARIMDHHPAHRAARKPVAVMERDSAFELDELPLLQDPRHHIRPHLRDDGAERPEALRNREQRDGADDQGHHHREHREGPQDGHRREAGRVHHDEFAVGIEPVQRVENRDEQRERRDDHHEGRHAQHGHFQEKQNRLALAGDEVELAQGLRDPDDPGQREETGEKRHRRNPQDVSLDHAHFAFFPAAKSRRSQGR